jgi:hypothetical protein
MWFSNRTDIISCPKMDRPSNALALAEVAFTVSPTSVAWQAKDNYDAWIEASPSLACASAKHLPSARVYWEMAN